MIDADVSLIALPPGAAIYDADTLMPSLSICRAAGFSPPPLRAIDVFAFH